MGWFWQSSTTASPNPGSTTSSSSSPPSSQQSTPAPAPQPPAQTPDQIEVQKFLKSFMEQAEPKTAAAAPPPQTTTPSQPAEQKPSSSSFTSWLPWSKSTTTETSPQEKTEPAPPPLPAKGRSPQSRKMSEYNLPTTMSCRDAFDYAWHCHTAGSQWNAVYRYGEMRTCSELWDDWWFCMRARNYSEEGRKEAIRQHYRAKEEKKYGGGKPSSEDIWESREERVEVGTQFRKDFPPPIEDDAAFRRSEIERRKRIRRELGIESDEGDNKKE